MSEVLVCRGCCCGTERKHPGTDHAGQLAALLDAADASSVVRAREVECVGHCDRSNVVVLRPVGPSPHEAVWLGGVVTRTQTLSLAEWMAAGGDLTDVPPELLMSRFEGGPSRSRRAAG